MRGATTTLRRACLALPALAASAQAQAVIDATPVPGAGVTMVSASAASVPAASAPAAGAKVRVALADTAVHLRRALFVRRLPAQEGRLVRLDDDAVTVRLAAWRELHLPASSVHRLEVRTGPGRCRTSVGAFLGCVAVGAAGGALAQYALEREMAWPSRASAVRGLGIGLVVAAVMGRDRWEAVPGWSPE